ncbi:hypothetical protein AB0D59_49880 [Streptomyces sp. NPDC048417]|uniref:hypothetical protein n=1 Tax=Streptomyces sp. NPDC048417 TaxID=3155387 RepID=UPI00342BB222
MSEPTRYWLIKPLPRPVVPFPQESEQSYLKRLGDKNKVLVQRLLNQSHWLNSQQDYIDRLAIASGQPRASLVRAIPLLGQQTGPFVPGRPDRSPALACRHCVARRTGNYTLVSPVTAWKSHFHDHVCPRHKLWIGKAVAYYHQQTDLSGLPDVVDAQRRHYRLLRRYGHTVLDACYEHCSTLWAAVLTRGYRLSDRHRRLEAMGADPHTQIWDPRRHIAVYPEIVEAMSLYASPHWRRLALAEGSEYLQFRAEFIRRLPQEKVLRRTSKPWFFKELGETARDIEAAVSRRA